MAPLPDPPAVVAPGSEQARRATARVAGLVLAAGAGRRFGGPKALARAATGEPWLARAVAVLRAAGATPIVVALGAGLPEAADLVPEDARAVRVPDWAEGVAAALRAGLATLAAEDPDAVLVTLVDLPDLPVEAGIRLLERAGSLRPALRRALWHGTPGHPVLLGADHLAGVVSSASGDRGAGPYLAAHGVLDVECGDLGDGSDRDRPLSP